MIAYLIMVLCLAQPVETNKTNKILDDKGTAKTPFPAPKCSGDVRYHNVSEGEKAEFTGYVFTPDATSCLVRKFNWCADAWTAHIDSMAKECESKRAFITEEARLSIKQCDKLKNECFIELENANKWYRNPWFIASMGFIAGATAASLITYFSVNR